METLGTRLRLSRIAAQLSQRAVARELVRVGYAKGSGSMVARYEQGVNVPSADYVRVFCEALDVNPSWLLSGAGRRQWRREDESRHGRLEAAAWMEDFAAWLRRDLQRGDPTPVEALDPFDLIEPGSVSDQRKGGSNHDG